MKRISPFLSEVEVHLTHDELNTLREAYDLARQIYGITHCPTGETYVAMVEKVGRLLLPLHPDVQTLIAGLLQYARTKENLVEIKSRFGKEVIDIITSLSILEGVGVLSMHSPAQLKRIALVLSKDIRVLLIFLHNRLYILENANALQENEKVTLAQETLSVLAPICARLGIYSLKYALETIAFVILYPNEASLTWENLNTVRREHTQFVVDAQRMLENLLKKERVRAHIAVREKHPYSIFRKMKHKGLTQATDLYDLLGMRILVDNVEDCYRVLGIVHRMYQPITHRIKDYIATPKPNGYRSLHTTILGLSLRDASFPVEIQIRTFEMDEEAEYGVAAHWNYKENVAEEPKIRQAWTERMKALKQLSESAASMEEDEEDFGEEVLDRIYVLTPKGDPVELPKGATPLDFAFRIHTDIGLSFRSANVNGAIATIDQQLENGDMVEIKTWNEPRPSPEWIKQVHTKDARAKIRGHFHQNDQARGVRPLRLTPCGADGSLTEGEERRHPIHSFAQKKLNKYATSFVVKLDSETDLPYRYARCCTPQKHSIQRPSIVGFVNRSGNVLVHYSGCRMLKDANPDRFVRANWVEDEKKPRERKPLLKKIFSRVK